MYHILIVEDEYLLRSELAFCEDWASLGFSAPLLAEDGEQGLRLALEKKPDVILTDIRMPNLDGLGMIREIREKELKCLCIVLSGYDDFTYAVEALRYGVMDYLLKPLDEQRLHQALGKAVKLLDERQTTEGVEPTPVSNLYLQKAIEYMKEHYASDIRISDVAQALYISDAYLGRLFIREHHTKFTDYLNQLRIQKSLQLLRDPQLKLYQVAQMIGYRDQQYFSNVFKRMMSLTPFQYRHRFTNAPEEIET